jgi:alpha-L-fucosidase
MRKEQLLVWCLISVFCGPGLAQEKRQAEYTWEELDAAYGVGNYQKWPGMSHSYGGDAHWLLAPGIPYDVDPGYEFAPEESLEKFRDMKYGLRIHWGPSAIVGEGCFFLTAGSSGQDMSIMRDKTRMWDPYRVKLRHFFYDYLWREWNPVAFDADQWAEMMVKQGFKYFVYTTKTHVGFSMWDTKTRVKKRFVYHGPNAGDIVDCDTAFGIMDGPFKRDIVKEIVEAGRKRDLGIGLYFSNPDWFDADFRVATWGAPYVDTNYTPRTDPEGFARMAKRHHDQVAELLTNYGHIDMLGFDLSFDGNFWPYMEKNILSFRKHAPNTMFRRRGLGGYGDYQSPENGLPSFEHAKTIKTPWHLIHTLGRSFFYEPDVSQYRSREWVLETLIDCTAKGGNFMISVGPDQWGNFHPEVIKRLDYVGRWLKVNGESIYATRPYQTCKEGDVYYTRSKDNKTVYGISMGWPGETLQLTSVRPTKAARISLLGDGRSLDWRLSADGLVIELPERLQAEENRPCQQAYVVKIEMI